MFHLKNTSAISLGLTKVDMGRYVKLGVSSDHRPFSYSTKEPGSSVIFIHFYTRRSIQWRYSFDPYCANSKILQNEAKYRLILILFRIAKRSIGEFMLLLVSTIFKTLIDLPQVYFVNQKKNWEREIRKGNVYCFRQTYYR